MRGFEFSTSPGIPNCESNDRWLSPRSGAKRTRVTFERWPGRSLCDAALGERPPFARKPRARRRFQRQPRSGHGHFTGAASTAARCWLRLMAACNREQQCRGRAPTSSRLLRVRASRFRQSPRSGRAFPKAPDVCIYPSPTKMLVVAEPAAVSTAPRRRQRRAASNPAYLAAAAVLSFNEQTTEPPPEGPRGRFAERGRRARTQPLCPSLPDGF